MMLEIIFWIAVFAGVYPYVIYPFAVKLLAALRERPVRVDSAFTLPSVTVITAAYNEARHIEATVLNKLAQDYPADKLEVIVVSDGSEDGTDAIVQAIAARDARVRLIRQEPRQGKTSGLNLAVPRARGDILVFADANSIYRDDAVRRLVANFSDPSVGYVTGHMVYVDPDGSVVGDGCTAYMRYENVLRRAETRVGSVVGVDGGIDAARKALYRPMRADQLPDFILPLNVVEQGYRVVYEPLAVLNEHTLTTQDAEYRMRVRVTLRSLWALWDKRGLLNPFRYGLFSWQLLSHKLLRYVAFIPLLLTTVLSVWLAGRHWIYLASLAAHGLLLFSVLIGVVTKGKVAGGPLRYASYFVLLNVACAVAAVRFLRGEKQAIWQPRGG